MDKVPSILMCVGEDNYTLAQFVDEAFDQGISKRISITSIPDGLIPFVSKVFVAHPKAIIKVTKQSMLLLINALTIADAMPAGVASIAMGRLFDDQNNGRELFWINDDIEPQEYVPEYMLAVSYHFSKAPAKLQEKLIKDFGIKFCMGVFGYAPFTGLVYITRKGEDGLPEQLAHLDGYVEPVKVVHVKTNENDTEDDEND